MNATAELRRTPLNGVHRNLGARLVDFHGWELPVQFSSILKEHQAVRSRCGVFDVSHMGQIFIEGRRALDFLQRVNSNDVARAVPGRAVYSHLLNERGGVADDVILGCYGPGRYLMVVNAATADKDFAWLLRHAPRFDLRVENRSGRYAMLAVQGPASAKVVGELVQGAAELPRFGCIEFRLFGQEAFLQRTGYTGEDGFEAIVPNEIASRLWEEISALGRSFGMLACGLGARDTLRLEAGYLLYGQDIDEEHTPLEAGYAWVVKFDKGDFIGRDALLRQKDRGVSRRLAGFRLLEGGVPRPGAVLRLGDETLGTLCSATFSPTLGTGIATGYVDAPGPAAGERVTIEIHGRRAAAEAAAVPFYRRERSEHPHG